MGLENYLYFENGYYKPVDNLIPFINSISRRIMRLLKKSKSNPILPQKHSQTLKPGRLYLKQLENEVTKSRIAIQNMNHTQAIQGALYKRVQQLQKELQYCILNINHEQQKQKILKELNHIVKSEMSEVKAAQITKDQFMCSSYQKRIKKVEYDIKQILHKFNQEIAKINWLKEQANSARDQRVVYSNLFNKIQKEIKHYEELYRQNLIKNQLFLDQKRGGIIILNVQDVTTPSFDAIEETTQPTELIDRAQKQPKSSYSVAISKKQVKIRETKKSNLKSQTPNQLDLFITNLQAANDKQKYQREVNSITSRNSDSYNRDKESLIMQREAQIQKTIVQVQCRSFDEVFRVYGAIQHQNQQLVTQIIQLDENICYLQEEIEQKRKYKRDSEIEANRLLLEKAANSKKIKTKQSSTVQSNKNLEQQPLQYLIFQICQIIGVECQNLNDEVLKEIDRKIDQLGWTLVVDKKTRRDSKLVSIRQIYGDKGIGQLLEKIDKFGQSQKIYDLKMLREEYQKELGKTKKKGKRSI